jgi:hypothetical protein
MAGLFRPQLPLDRLDEGTGVAFVAVKFRQD